MPTELMISCEALTKRFGHFTAVDHVSFAVTRLNEPPEPSPGLSGAMPWVTVGQNLRSEGAQEALGKSKRMGLNPEHFPNGRFSHPVRAHDLFGFQSQGIAPTRSALGYILMAFQAIVLSHLYTF